MIEFTSDELSYLLAIASVVASLWASAHAVMYKRKSRAAAAWVGLIWLSPFFGAILYLLLGVNRLRERPAEQWPVERLSSVSPPASDPLECAIDRIADAKRTPGNQIAILENGDAAYPAMKLAIEGATRSVRLCTYIFDRDQIGREFADVLGAAVARGVDVRVLIDDLGARYSLPTIIPWLRERGIKVGRHRRTLWPWRLRYANLRNHRKSLVVDGVVGFTGGMNIRAGHMLGLRTREAVRDLHFRVEGPLVEQLDAVFCADWEGATGAALAPDAQVTDRPGTAVARCITDGPDNPTNSIRWTLLAALACSKERVRVVTPYFIPDAGLIAALATASLRGVHVEIILPKVNNLRVVKWAAEATLWQVLERGCHVFKTDGPFDHTKLMIVDDEWCFFGSANWDARSLRLNFELNVECSDPELVAKLNTIVDDKLAGSREVTLQDVDSRPLHIRLRDGLARLLSPYL